MGFFRFFGDFNKSEGEDAKMTNAVLLPQVSVPRYVLPLSFRNVGCSPATFLIVLQQRLRISYGVTPTAVPFCKDPGDPCSWDSQHRADDKKQSPQRPQT